jgi:8-oxo-dGTP diphosphatase
MKVVAAIIERGDRRLLIGQRRRNDTSPLKWEFPGGKVQDGEEPEAALARELREELCVTLRKSVEIAHLTHQYAETPELIEVQFFAVEIAEEVVTPNAFEQVHWVLPKELADYDFLSANAPLVADLATGRIKAAEILERAVQEEGNR